jgi:transcriptional regulator GlxA family with amidase domain
VDAAVAAAGPRRGLALLSVLGERARRAGPPDPLVRAAIQRLARDDVSSLARELSVSERQLRRRFAGAVGYGPKRLARVLRLGRALAAARTDGDLARAAFECGYADQAHFSNDCRALAGVPPSALLGG